MERLSRRFGASTGLYFANVVGSIASRLGNFLRVVPRALEAQAVFQRGISRLAMGYGLGDFGFAALRVR